ncbi:MAG: hypothetical protein L0K23_04880, partial [Lacticaseibacillus paracasei]|nr:hypothetical protein [Lacticaseibacillus paracasei]
MMVEQQATYRDPTENGFPDDYDQSKVDSRVAIRAKAVREKQKGVDVRGALAQGVEIAGAIAGESVQSAIDAKAIAKDTQGRFNDQISGTTNSDEVIDARRPLGGNAYQTLGQRLDDMQSDPAKLKYMSLAVTYNSNEPDRYKNIIKQYQSIGTPISFINMCSISNVTASDVTATSSDELQAAIKQATDAGYKIVLLKPHVGPDN